MHKYLTLGIVLALLVSSALLLGMIPPNSVEPADTAGTPGSSVSVQTNQMLRIGFSETGYFYNEAIDVSIASSDTNAKIYYTTDGSEPTSASEEYSKPLHFEPSGGMNTVVLKAIAVRGDTVTRPLVHTYFIGKDVDERFNTLVFSLSTDDVHLYDYETGILVEGKIRDDYIAEGHRFAMPNDPANFNLRGMEGERPVYVEVFTPEGERVVAQAAGLRVSGGWSRSYSQKSLRIIARKEYEPNAGKFHYSFFTEDTQSGEHGAPITEYNSLVLRNGGNDRDEAMLRNEMMSALARDAGFREVSGSRAAAVFLNGEYYGFAWLQASVDEQYLQDIYSAPTKDFDIVGNGEEWYESDNTAAVNDLKELYTYSEKDFTDDKVFEEFTSLVDIDNLLFYYAYEIYMGNDDWPHNNMKRWRYTGPQVEGLAPELDGRWRFVLYDLDWALGLYGESYNVSTFNNVLVGSKRRSELLISLLRRGDMATKFTTYMCDIISNVVTPEKVENQLNILNAEAKSEILTAVAARKYSVWVSEQTILEKQSELLSFSKKRGDYIMGNLSSYFGYNGGTFEVRVSGGDAVIGTQKAESSEYFKGMTIPVSAAPERFTVFDHWELNGKIISEPDIKVTAADAVDGIVEIKMVTREEYPPLVISEVYASSQSNGCVLVNTSGAPVSTAGLYVSDDPSNPLRYALPSATVEPGGTLTLAGKGSGDASDLLKIQMNFNLKNGEILLLSDSDGNILDSAAPK